MPPLGNHYETLPPTEAEAELAKKLAEAERTAAKRAFGIVTTSDGRIRSNLRAHSAAYKTEDQAEGTETVAWLSVPPIERNLAEMSLTTQVVPEGAEDVVYGGPHTTHVGFDNFTGVPRVCSVNEAYKNFTTTQRIALMEAINDTLAQF